MKRSGVFLCLLLVLLTCGCKKNEPVAETGFYMDTLCRFTAYGGDAAALLAACHKTMAELDATLDHREETSALYALNHSDGVWTPLDAHTYAALTLSCELAAATDGAFDPTIGAVLTAWDDFSGRIVPSATDCAAAVARVSYQTVELDAASMSARIGKGQSVALGAIAKGYAADVLAALYRSYDCTGVVSLGGNVMTIGTKPDGSAFSVGIQDPADETALLTTVALADRSAVTSGAYQRYFTKSGVTYHHIFDPSTGMPSDSGLLSVTVFCEQSARADALSTALFVLGCEKGAALLETQTDVSALFVLSDGRIVEVSS